MKTKQRMRLEIKDVTPEGTFEGILSPYGNVDGGNDVVKAGAYAKTLKDQGATRPASLAAPVRYSDRRNSRSRTAPMVSGARARS